MAAVGLAAGVTMMRLALGLLLAVAVAAACGGETPVLDAESGEVRIVVRADSEDAVLVGLERRNAAGEWDMRVSPDDQRLELGDDWRLSSGLTAVIPGSVAVTARFEGFEIDGVAELGDLCAILSLRPDTETRFTAPLWVVVHGGPECDQTITTAEFTTPSEGIELDARIAARQRGNCVELRLDVRRPSGAWRELSANAVCGLSSDDGEWLAARAVGLPYQRDRDVIEVRHTGQRLSAALNGLLLATPCDMLTLQRGHRTLWLHRYDAETCKWAGLERLNEFEGAPPPLDQLDFQQHAVYDWETEISANLLPALWQERLTLERAQAIADAVYRDFLGAGTEPPTVATSTERSDYTGAYYPELHVIELRSDGMRADVVIHETAHAMLRVAASTVNAYYADPRHGPLFSSLMIALWARYAEGFDPEAALALADLYGVGVDDLLPFEAAGDAETLRVVLEAIAGP